MEQQQASFSLGNLVLVVMRDAVWRWGTRWGYGEGGAGGGQHNMDSLNRIGSRESTISECGAGGNSETASLWKDSVRIVRN